jgi:hypothetical protein
VKSAAAAKKQIVFNKGKKSAVCDNIKMVLMPVLLLTVIFFVSAGGQNILRNMEIAMQFLGTSF